MIAPELVVAHEALDWSLISGAIYRIDQSIRYEYPSPISRLRHKLVVAPRAAHGDQRRLSHELFVSPDAPARQLSDAFGNDVVLLEVARVERSIAFEFTSRVERDRGLGPHVIAQGADDETAPVAAPRRLIRADEAILDAAADLRVRYRDRADLARAICDYLYREMIYTKGVTDVFTTAAVAFTMRRGVCQDYAHIAIAMSTACGLPVRYVSGHLLGEGATHAWVEFLVPAERDRLRVISLDPTNGCVTNLRYIVVAIGRDYEDIAPTSGVFVGRSAGAIFSNQSVKVTGITYAA